MKNNFWYKLFLYVFGFMKPPTVNDFKFKCGDIVRHKLNPEKKMLVVRLLYNFDFHTASYEAYGCKCSFVTLNKDSIDFKYIDFYESELEMWVD